MSKEIIITFNDERISIANGNSWVYTDSLNLADVINYEHKEVLKRIRKVIDDYNLSTRELNSPVTETQEYIHRNTDFTYTEAFYTDTKGELRPFYQLSKDLLVLVIFSFRKLPKAQEIQKTYIARFNAMEKELHWLKARYLGIDVRNNLTDAIKEYLENPKWYDYKNFTDLVYIILYDQNTQQMRVTKNLAENANVRNFLNQQELEQVKAVENEMAVLISYGLDYKKIKNMMISKYRKEITIK